MDARKGRWQPRVSSGASIHPNGSLALNPSLPPNGYSAMPRRARSSYAKPPREREREATDLIREQPCDVGADGPRADGADEGGSDNAMFGNAETLELQIPNIR